jgi:hypothetical protein
MAAGAAGSAVSPKTSARRFRTVCIPTANYITGPTHLLNWGITTIDKLDFDRVRAEAIAFTEMILRLGRTPRDELGTFDLS